MVKVGTYHGEANPPGRREPGYVIDNVLQPVEESLGDRLWRAHPIIMAALTGCAAFLVVCAVGFIGLALF